MGRNHSKRLSGMNRSGYFQSRFRWSDHAGRSLQESGGRIKVHGTKYATQETNLSHPGTTLLIGLVNGYLVTPSRIGIDYNLYHGIGSHTCSKNAARVDAAFECGSIPT